MTKADHVVRIPNTKTPPTLCTPLWRPWQLLQSQTEVSSVQEGAALALLLQGGRSCVSAPPAGRRSANAAPPCTEDTSVQGGALTQLLPPCSHQSVHLLQYLTMCNKVTVHEHGNCVYMCLHLGFCHIFSFFIIVSFDSIYFLMCAAGTLQFFH